MLNDAHLRKLRSINSIGALLTFLREELDWPIQEADVDDVTFSYEPDELGLKEEHAPKVNKIYQIRPITTDQPWGIFFIDFDNKKLPVTIMRRILNGLVKKRRGSNTGSGWNAGDLLFMTTYGEEAEGMREVAFAHFREHPGDLPTLNVLDWNAQRSVLSLQSTYSSLKNNLGWPPDPANKEDWRKQWSKSFQHGIGHSIKTSKALAEELARLSRNIRQSVNEVLQAETEKGQMTKLYKAFREALLHDLEPDQFADTFSQTISYGLLTAAFSRTPEAGSGVGTHLLADDAPALVPVTNPFLQEVLETFLIVGGRNKAGIDFDYLGVQDVVELLRSPATDLNAIRNDFGNRKPGEDPVIHFYEDYLAAYDKPEKKKRGVFYTPQPVVSYIVRSVHEVLQTQFDLQDGLASTFTWGEMASRNPGIKVPEVMDGNGRAVDLSDEPFVVILDPATGTATFLVEVIDIIHKHLQQKWKESRDACWLLLRQTANHTPQTTFLDFWNAYVPDHLLPRLYGYELMMAPYAIAHMKVGLKLGETGYRFSSSQRVRIYLTNALEPASEIQARLALDWEALAHEAMAVKAVKETQRFTVVIGNPPYSGNSANASKDEKGNRNFIGNLVHDYYFVDGAPLGEKNPKWLQDDYVKFLRLGQYLIQQASVGALGMITNHGYLDNPTFRGMRRSLMQSFDGLRFLDLHGNSKKKEVAPDGSKDENVFDIMQGVAICLVEKLGNAPVEKTRHTVHADLQGTRQRKYDAIAAIPPRIGPWRALLPNAPFFLFDEQDQNVRLEYDCGKSLFELFQVSGEGFKTHRDDFAVAFTLREAESRLGDFTGPEIDDAQLRDKYGLEDTGTWNLRIARDQIRKARDNVVNRCLYRPFDFRYCLLTSAIMDRPRLQTQRNLLQTNVALATTRSVEISAGFEHVLCASGAMDHHAVSLKEMNYLFALYRYPTEKEAAMGIRKEPNLSPAFVDALAGAIGRRFESSGSSSGSGGLFAAAEPGLAPPQTTLEGLDGHLGPTQGTLGAQVANSGQGFSPEEVFHYIYAVLHSPTYRARYAEFLKIDFPRIPLPGGPEVFDALVPLGAELVTLHLMESPRLDTPMTTFKGPGEARVEKVAHANDTVWIDKAQNIGFQGVPEGVWNFHIGGYQVCEKWLKDRGPKKGKPGRILSSEDIAHYQKIVVALSETIRIMKEIDIVIDQHGGWPNAFKGADA